MPRTKVNPVERVALQRRIAAARATDVPWAVIARQEGHPVRTLQHMHERWLEQRAAYDDPHGVIEHSLNLYDELLIRMGDEIAYADHSSARVGAKWPSVRAGAAYKWSTMLTKTFHVAAVAIIATLVAVGASPLQAREPAYGGIGATIAHFNAAHANGRGNPPAGTTYYRVDRTRNGRVEDYHVVVGWKSKRSTAALLALLTGRELPSDAKLVNPYNGFCATYRSRWLGRVIGLPDIQVAAPEHTWWNGVWAGRGPPSTGCKG